MRALAILAVFAPLALAACSTEYELTPLQSAAMRCKPSNIQRGEMPCLKQVQKADDEPLFCYRTLGNVECYARPRPDLAAETVRRIYPAEVTDPPVARLR